MGPRGSGARVRGALTMDQFIPCQSCGQTVNRFLEVCPYCQQDPGGDRTDKPVTLPPLAPGVPHGRFYPLQSVALFAQLLFALFILGNIVSLVTGWAYRNGLLDLAADRPTIFEDVALAEDRYFAAIGVVSIGYIVLSIVFVIWFWRTYSNLLALGRSRTRGAGWAIGSWFIPVAGLFIPYGIGAEIWTQSRPEPGPVSAHRDPNMEPVISWWALYVIMSLVNQVGLFTDGENQDPAVLAGIVGVDLVSSVVAIAAAVAAVRFVRLVTARQEALEQIVGVPAFN